ncbi:MAG: radical SAM protein [Acidobacteria bacterium]|nr:radical SAM protein [Acidobacteriota bacterium]
MPSAIAPAVKHPCFYASSRGKYGRIHLPVAPSCNIQCAYCRRDYDCPHEARPGVSAGVLSPAEACARLQKALEEMPHITVAAVAGPGDAFADPELTLETFELIRRKNVDISLCVSSNGLSIKDYIPQLRDLNVGYVTITINAIDPAIGMRLYKWIETEGKVIGGVDAARILISRQLQAISLLKDAGITVKVNSVVVPGVNENHLLFLARKMGSLGVDLMNFIPLIPLPGTDMENMEPPGAEGIRRLRQKAASYVLQMHHCTRCRSDAAGPLTGSQRGVES